MEYKTECKNIVLIEKFRPKNIWSQEEQHKMLLFIDENREELSANIRANIDSTTRINKSQFFIKMSKFIGTKSDIQCKSRYQKKERALLEAANFPTNLIDEYMSIKKGKSNCKNLKKRTSTVSTNATNSMVKQEEMSFIGINTFHDLKTVIINDCMPKIQNDTVKNHLEAFVCSLPLNDQIKQDLPSCNFCSLVQAHDNTNFSLDFEQDYDKIYLDEY